MNPNFAWVSNAAGAQLSVASTLKVVGCVASTCNTAWAVHLVWATLTVPFVDESKKLSSVGCNSSTFTTQTHKALLQSSKNTSGLIFRWLYSHNDRFYQPGFQGLSAVVQKCHQKSPSSQVLNSFVHDLKRLPFVLAFFLAMRSSTCSWNSREACFGIPKSQEHIMERMECCPLGKFLHHLLNISSCIEMYSWHSGPKINVIQLDWFRRI